MHTFVGNGVGVERRGQADVGCAALPARVVAVDDETERKVDSGASVSAAASEPVTVAPASVARWAKAAVAHKTGLTYTNALPFPAEQAATNRRGVLRDYCFFAGPRRTISCRDDAAVPWDANSSQ